MKMAARSITALVLAWALPCFSMSSSAASAARQGALMAATQRSTLQPQQGRSDAPAAAAAAAVDRVSSLPGWDGAMGFDMHAGCAPQACAGP